MVRRSLSRFCYLFSPQKALRRGERRGREERKKEEKGGEGRRGKGREREESGVEGRKVDQKFKLFASICYKHIFRISK